MVLGEAVAVNDGWILDPVQQHVHAADAEHGVVEVEAVEQGLVKMLPELVVAQHLRVMLA